MPKPMPRVTIVILFVLATARAPAGKPAEPRVDPFGDPLPAETLVRLPRCGRTGSGEYTLTARTSRDWEKR